VLLIEPDGPFAKQRSLPSVLSWTIALPPESAPRLGRGQLKRPSTMEVPLDIRSAWGASRAVECLGIGVPVAVGKPFLLKL
jgi:hypothetical protein